MTKYYSRKYFQRRYRIWGKCVHKPVSKSRKIIPDRRRRYCLQLAWHQYSFPYLLGRRRLMKHYNMLRHLQHTTIEKKRHTAFLAAYLKDVSYRQLTRNEPKWSDLANWIIIIIIFLVWRTFTHIRGWPLHCTWSESCELLNRLIPKRKSDSLSSVMHSFVFTFS